MTRWLPVLFAGFVVSFVMGAIGVPAWITVSVVAVFFVVELVQ